MTASYVNALLIAHLDRLTKQRTNCNINGGVTPCNAPRTEVDFDNYQNLNDTYTHEMFRYPWVYDPDFLLPLTMPTTHLSVPQTGHRAQA